MLNHINQPLSKARNNIVFIAILAVVLFLPIFKGGNYPGAMPIFTLVVGGMFLLSIFQCSFERYKYWLWVWGSVSIGVLVHAFVYPLFFKNERFFIDGLTPQLAAELNTRQLSNIRMLEFWSYFTVMWFFSWRVSLLELKQLRVLLLVLFLASIFQALFGLVHFGADFSSVLGLWEKEFYLRDATGTFVNRNHFAGMLAITCPVVVTSLLMKRSLILSSFSKLARNSVAVFYMVVVMLALISSHSRMGLAAAIFGLIVSYYFFNKHQSQTESKFRKLKLLTVVILLCLFSVWFGLGDILQRYIDLEDGNSRFDVWKSMFRDMSFDVWLFGVGPGMFESVFQIIKPSNFSVSFLYAHNDYLEFLFEFGVFLSLFVLSALFFWFKNSSQALMNSNPLKYGLYGAIAAVSLHSLVDFNMQVPGSALFFYLVLGILMNPVIFQESEEIKITKGGAHGNSKGSILPKSKREWLDLLRSD